MNLNDFGTFFREQRKKNNLTQKDVAKLLNVTNSSISKWERGLCLPEVTKFDEIAAVFNVSTSDVINCKTELSEESSQCLQREKPMLKRMIITASALITVALLIFIGIKYFAPKSTSELIEARIEKGDESDYKVLVEPTDLTYANKTFFISEDDFASFDVELGEVYHIRYITDSKINNGDYIHKIQSMEKVQ
jgi:transcriptional regulator with XRE-family HTH domain